MEEPLEDLHDSIIYFLAFMMLQLFQFFIESHRVLHDFDQRIGLCDSLGHEENVIEGLECWF